MLDFDDDQSVILGVGGPLQKSLVWKKSCTGRNYQTLDVLAGCITFGQSQNNSFPLRVCCAMLQNCWIQLHILSWQCYLSPVSQTNRLTLSKKIFTVFCIVLYFEFERWRNQRKVRKMTESLSNWLTWTLETWDNISFKILC